VNNDQFFGMQHLTCGTRFLLLFVLAISLVHHHYPAQVLILDLLTIFLVAFSTLVLKPSFPQNLSLHSHLSIA